MQEQKDYLHRIEKQIETYTIKAFYQKQHVFGSIALYTNSSKNTTPQQIYTNYKSRGEVENMFDTLKNIVEGDITYMQNEQTLEGWMLINYIAPHWYYKIYQLLIQNDLIQKYSTMDFFMLLKEIRIVKINEEWLKAEVIQRTVDLLKKVGIDIT